MKIQGIVAEYNPFHNGHAYHIQQGKFQSDCSHTIVIMSGNFVQRGEPAIFDKFIRSEMAIKGGADIVIELPVIYSLASAEYFAHGAVKLLDSLGVVDYISFGCENDDLSSFSSIAEILVEEPSKYKNLIKKYLATGISFPKAREKAVSDCLFAGGNIENIFQPNNILAIEYLKTLKRINSNIQANPVKRIGVSYYSSEIDENYTSATKLRSLIKGHKFDDINKTVPLSIAKEIIDLSSLNSFQDIDDYSQILFSKLISSSIDELRFTNDVSEGIENRIMSLIDPHLTSSEFIEKISTKRYTKTRIQRILMKFLIGLKNHHYKDKENNITNPQYARVLAFNSKGRQILQLMKKNASVPIITNINKIESSLYSKIENTLQLDILSTDIYSLIGKSNLHRDLTTKPFMME